MIRSYDYLTAMSVIASMLLVQGCGNDRNVEQEVVGANTTSLQSPPAVGEQALGAGPAAETAHPGARIYAIYCQNCHGPQGRGDGPVGAGLNPKPASFAANAFRLDADGDNAPGELEDIMAVTHEGAAKYGGSPLMAPWPMLSDEQLRAVSEYVKSLAETG